MPGRPRSAGANAEPRSTSLYWAVALSLAFLALWTFGWILTRAGLLGPGDQAAFLTIALPVAVMTIAALAPVARN